MSSQPEPAFGQPEFLSSPAEPGRRRPRRWPVVVSAIATPVVAAGAVGGVLAYRALSGGGPQPDQYAPAGSFAFVKLDLDPPAEQKLAARRLADRFPGVRGKDVAGIRDQFLGALLRAQRLDYGRDVQPWIGDRVAVAGYLDARKRPQLELIVAYRDRAKAAARLGAVGQVGFSVQDGYVVIGQTQPVVDQAVRTAAAGNLGADPTYHNDVGRLPANRILTAWGDLARLRPLVPAADLRTRLVIGGRVTANSVEIEGHAIGGPVDSGRADALAGLGQLPADSAIGLSAVGLGSGLADAGTLASRPRVDRLLNQLGLRSAGQLGTLLGEQAVLGLRLVPHSNQADAALLTRQRDPAAAERVARALAARLRQLLGLPVTAGRSGNRLLLATSPAYAAVVSKGGGLSRTPGYRAALAGSAGRVTIAAYADLERLLGTRAGAWQAAGLTAARQHGEAVWRVRVVAR